MNRVAFLAAVCATLALSCQVKAEGKLTLRTVSVVQNKTGDATTSVTLNFGEGTSANKLFLAYGAEAGAADSTNGWTSVVQLDDVAATETSRTVDVPEGWGSSVKYLRFFTEKKISGATAVSYLSSSSGTSAGGPYIDTGFKPNQDSGAEYGFKAYTTFTNYGTPFGCRNESTAQFFCGASLANGFDYWFRRYGNKAIDDGKNLPKVAGEHKFVINKNVFTLDGVTHTLTANTFQSAVNATIFAVNNNGTITQFMPMDLYYLDLYDNGTIVRSYTPCVKDDGTPALYDSVNGVFYENQNADYEFTYGTPVFSASRQVSDEVFVLPADYAAASYVESCGTQYVNTAYVPNANSSIAARFSVVDFLAKDRAYVFGCYGAGDAGRCQFAYGAPAFFGYGGSYDNTTNLAKDTEVHDVTLAGGKYAVDGVEKFSSAWSAGSSLVPVYLFANDGNGKATTHAAVRIYGFAVSEEGDPKCDLRPVVRKADAVAGFYDATSESFKASANEIPLYAKSDALETVVGGLLMNDGFAVGRVSGTYAAGLRLDGRPVTDGSSVGFAPTNAFTSATGVFQTRGNGLALPSCFADAGIEATGNSKAQLYSTGTSTASKDSYRSTRKPLAEGLLKREAGTKLYFRALMTTDAASVKQLVANDTFGRDNTYGLAWAVEPSSNYVYHCIWDTDRYLGFGFHKKSSGTGLSLSVKGDDGVMRSYPLITSYVSGETYVCVAEVTLGEDTAVESIRAFARPVSSYDPDAIVWTRATDVNLIDSAVAPNALFLGGNYCTGSGCTAFDEIAVATELAKVAVVSAGGSARPILGEASLAGNVTAGATASVMVAGGASANATVTCYMGKDTTTWTAVDSWTHNQDEANYSGTYTDATFGDTVYAAFKLTYTFHDAPVEIWSATNSLTFAADLLWNNDLGGDWNLATNWDPQAVPNSLLSTTFADAAGEVSATADGTSKTIKVSTTNPLSFDFNGNSLYSPYFTIAKSSANMTIADGRYNFGTFGGTSDAVTKWTFTVAPEAVLTTSGPTTIPTDNSKFIIDGGVVTNKGQWSVSTRGNNSNTGAALIIQNGGYLRQEGHLKCNCWYGGHVDVLSGSHLDASSIAIGADGDSSRWGYLMVSNATLTASSYLSVGGDDRHSDQSLRLYQDDESTPCVARIDGNVGTSPSGTTVRNGMNHYITVAGAFLDVGGDLRIGAPVTKATTNSLRIARTTAKVAVAKNLVLNNNSSIQYTVPEKGFGSPVVVEVAKQVTLSDDATIKVNASKCASGKWMTLLSAAEGITGLTELNLQTRVTVTATYKDRPYGLRLQKDASGVVTALQFRVKASGLKLIVR